MTNIENNSSLTIENCEDEPIRIPGSIQPHGILLVVQEPQFEILQASTSTNEFLGLEPEQILKRNFSDLLEPESFETFCASLQFDLETVNPLHLVTRVGPQRDYDAVLHRSGGHLLVELEPQHAVEELFSSSYHAIKTAINRLNVSTDLEELCDITAQEVRNITGFDRVMIYRFDEEWNGVVIAEAKHDELEPLVGLHYPASDIPAQARALYTTQWLRLIADSSAKPSPLVPSLDPTTNASLDMSDSVLRSVSPIHLEYLHNMGVKASMSISLIDKGKLWGLIACHHYADAHAVAYAARAGAEFLGQTASVLLAAKDEKKNYEQVLMVKSVHAQILDAMAREKGDVMLALTHFQPTVMELTNATGAVVQMGEERSTLGRVPNNKEIDELAKWIWASNTDVFSTDSLAKLDKRWESISHVASGVVAVTLSARKDSFVIWFRPEETETVEWAGDPREKYVVGTGTGTARLGPRKSFDSWVEKLRLRSKPWNRAELQAATELGRGLTSNLLRSQQESLEVIQTFHQDLTLGDLPVVKGLTFAARYHPGDGGSVGGDWYDVVSLPDGRVAMSIGDVAGHGIPAAATMGQLRGGLRAFLLEGRHPSQVISQLNSLVNWLLPNDLATGIVAIYDPQHQTLDVSSAGHLPPLLYRNGHASFVEANRSPALGIDSAVQYGQVNLQLQPNDTIMFYTDGLVESRKYALDVGLSKLADAVVGDYSLADLCDRTLVTMEAHTAGSDDVAIVSMRVANQ